MASMLFMLKRTMLEKQDRGKIRILCQNLQIGTDHLLQVFIGGNSLVGNRRNPFLQKLESAIKDVKQNFLLGSNMVIETCFFQVDSFSNILHRCTMESLLAKDLRCRFQNIFSRHTFSLPTGRLFSYNTGGSYACQGRVQSQLSIFKLRSSIMKYFLT